MAQPSWQVVCPSGNPAATDGATHRSPEETDHKRPRWGRVIAVKIFRTRPKSFPWSENLITVVKAIRDTSSAVPIPYIQPAAAIVLLILEVVQSAKRNEQDLEELATGLVGIIKTIQTTLAAHCTVYDAPPSYLRQCEEFISMLSKMLVDLSHVVYKHKSWTRFFTTTETHDRIAFWRRQMDDQRNNFTMMTVMNINLKLYTLPRELGYPWESSKPLRLVDAMNITIDLPVVLCSNQDDFHDLLSFLFRKRRGRYFVDRGQYNLTIGESDRAAPTILTADQWPYLVKPGSNIDMNIVLRHNGLDENDGRQCPSCKHRCIGASLGEDVICPSCQTMFRVSRGIIEELEEAGISRTESPRRPLLTPLNPIRASASASSRSEYLSTSSWGVQEQADNDIHYFRRFHVIMETGRLLNGPRHSSSLNNPPNALLTHFGQSGRMEDLEAAITSQRKAHTLLPHGHPDCSASLSNLGVAMSSRFERLGRMEDLEEAITYHREALALVPHGHPDRSSFLNNLGVAVSSRFEQSGRIEDLEKAITCQREALALHPHGHLERPSSLGTIWAREAKIRLVSGPYYKITYLTRATLELKRRERPFVPMAQIRPAEKGDLDGVAQLCHGFAALSPSFTLTEKRALAEARELVENKIVWILTLWPHRVVSLVAFTHNSKNVATITKVFTDPTQRGMGYAERLVRAVCEYLLYDRSKETIVLFVETDDPAATVYQRVGFVDVGGDTAPADGVDT